MKFIDCRTFLIKKINQKKKKRETIKTNSIILENISLFNI